MSRSAIGDPGFLGLIVSSAILPLCVTMLCLYQMGAFHRASGPDVHVQMAHILSDEMPSDVTRLSLLPNGTNQDCSLSNGRMKERVTLLNPPHEAYVFGTFSRNGTIWEGDNDASGWLRAFEGPKEFFDSEAISASDFRQLLQRCVAAVRQQRHRPRTSMLTKEQKQASWALLQAGTE
jgi:hypothetical protein